jgi:D-amino-acid dehydrogenase
MRVAVVGAGVLGASTAFHLAAAGADVVVVDQAHPGRATAAGAGIVCPWASEARELDWHRIADRGARYYPALLERLAALGEAETGYRRVGALVVAFETAALDRAEAFVRRRSAEAPETGALTRLSPAEARRLFPPLHPELAALRIAGGARVDGRRLQAALLRAAERSGARLVNGTAGLMTKDGRLSGVRIGADPLEADAVVVTAGAWAAPLLAPLGIALAVTPQRGQISHLRLEGTETGDWPVILPPGSHYLLSFEDSRVVVGATRETGAGFDHRITAAGQAEVLNEALRVAPGLGPATLIETRVGFRPVGPDIKPMLGLVPGVEGRLVLGNGLGPSGLTIGPYAGRLLAQLALGEAPELPLDAYDPMRGPAEEGSSETIRLLR